MSLNCQSVGVMKICTYIISIKISFSMSCCFQAFVCLIDSSVEKTCGLKTFVTAEELAKLTETLFVCAMTNNLVSAASFLRL